MLEINEVEYCKLNIKYTSAPEVVISKTEEALNELRKLPVPGFRPGKATNAAIKSKYKTRIHEWVKNKMVQESFDDILFETKLQPIGSPQVLDVKLDGNNFNCEFLILKKPDFELKEVKGLEIPKPHQNVQQTEYAERLIQELRVNNGDSVPYSDTDFVQIGDVVTLDYKTDSSSEEGKLYTVGSNLMPEFDDNIVGMIPGETREFKISLDEKSTNVTVTLHMGMKKMPAALDDSLAIKLGLENINKFREVVDGIAASRLKQHTDAQIADQIKIRLLSLHNFQLPDWLVNMEKQALLQKANITVDQLTEEEKNDVNKKAEESVKFALILDTIRQKNPEADLSDQEVINLIKQRIINQVSDPDAFLMDMQNKGQLIGMIANIRNEITLQYLINNAKIVE